MRRAPPSTALTGRAAIRRTRGWRARRRVRLDGLRLAGKYGPISLRNGRRDYCAPMTNPSLNSKSRPVPRKFPLGHESMDSSRRGLASAKTG